MAEYDLFKSDKLSKAVEALAEAVIITDPGGEISYVNPAFETITGYTREEVVGGNPRLLKSGQNPPELYKEMWNVLLRGEIWRGKVINKRKNGSTYHAELTISPIWTDTGRVINYVAVQHEVTETLEAREQARLVKEEYKVLHHVAKALHEAGSMEEMLKSALESITRFGELKAEYKAGIFFADPEKKVLRLFATVGEFTEEFLQREREVLYGECLCGKAAESGEMLVSNSCFTDTRHERTFKGMTDHGHYIVPLKSRSKLVGVLFLYTDANPPWYDRSQEILLSIGGLIADAIEHRWAEEKTRQQVKELAAANRKLTELNEVKNVFLGIASHDLRNPLYLLTSYSQVLLDTSQGSINESQRRLLQKMVDSGSHMKSLLNNLLDISKIESGKIELTKKEQDFNAIVENQVDFHRLVANKKNIQIQFKPAKIAPFFFDKGVIIQAVDNFIGNAVKFSFPNTQIFVTTEIAGTQVRLSVRDEGPGIVEEDQKLLFGEFQTLSAKPTGGEKSTGLGLTIVKKIICLHGGEVGVSSHSGRGSTFFFTLPTE